MLFDFYTEHLISEEEAQAITQPYWSELRQIWIDAWRLMKEIPEDTRQRIERCPIAKANVLNALAGTLVMDRFVGREAECLDVCDKLQFVKLYVTRRVVLRFNSLTSDFVVKHITASPQKHTYFLQEPLSGVYPGATRLTVGYITDRARTELASIVISLQVGDTPVFHFPIDQDGHGVLAVPSPSQPPKLPAARPHTDKVRKAIH